MKNFKFFDTWMSIILITVFLIASVINMDETFIYGYFVVGGWQIISMVIHAINGWFTAKGSIRILYHWVVAIVIALTILGLLVYPILYLMLFILLFAAPIMAIVYTTICYDETYRKMVRPLDLIK
ncbi:MAG: hypothetical protein JSU03_01415 [Bacteroidetes bacterium]|nr:hypothetical protein [Bacteroidota bacterium]MBS1755913.1 hypothetical protein [Bacteroidota bacterium]